MVFLVFFTEEKTLQRARRAGVVGPRPLHSTVGEKERLMSLRGWGLGDKALKGVQFCGEGRCRELVPLANGSREEARLVVRGTGSGHSQLVGVCRLTRPCRAVPHSAVRPHGHRCRRGHTIDDPVKESERRYGPTLIQRLKPLVPQSRFSGVT